MIDKKSAPQGALFLFLEVISSSFLLLF